MTPAEPRRDLQARVPDARPWPTEGPWSARRTLTSRVRRRIWTVLTLCTAAWALLHAVGAGYSWHFFSLGARLLSSASPTSGGLHLYAAHPELQIGPLAMLAAVPLTHLDPWQGRVVAIVLLTAEGPLLLAALVRTRERIARVADPLLLLAGLLLLPVWTEVATHFGHLDDALALAAVVAAGSAIQRGSAATSGVLLAVAADSKPWALACAALLLALPSDRRLRGVAVMTVGVTLAWAPFVLTDHGTLTALSRFTIPNVPDSALNALGVHDSSTPFWDRPAQLALGFVIAALAVRRGRWPQALLAVICARLLLDPETYAYYTSGLLVAAVLIDLYVPRRVVPMWTSAAALFYLVETVLAPLLPAHLLGLFRVSYCLAVLLMIVWPDSRADVADPSIRDPQRSSANERRPFMTRDWLSQPEYHEVPSQGICHGPTGLRRGPRVAGLHAGRERWHESEWEGHHLARWKTRL